MELLGEATLDDVRGTTDARFATDLKD
jgi:hypothetical protein